MQLKYSSLVDRVGGRTLAAWDIHYEALAAARRGEDAIALSAGDPDFATPEPIVEAAVTALRVRRRRDLVLEHLGFSERLRCLKPEAGMFMLVDITETGVDPPDFVHRLYRATGVSVLDAGAFGPSAARFIRVAFANGNDRLIEACRRIKRFVAGLPYRLGAEIV